MHEHGRPDWVPDFVSLQLLAGIEEFGSISAAAGALGYSQPAVSERLTRLERSTGLVLLHRSPAGSELTAIGSVILERAKSFIAAGDELAASLAALREKDEAALRLAASFTIAEYLLPCWIQRLRRRVGDVAIELCVTNSEKVADAAGRGTVDLGFLESPEVPDGLDSQLIGRDEVVIVVSSRHPLARSATSFGSEELRRSRFVVREAGSGTRQAFERVRGPGSGPPLAELGSTTAVVQAVVAGMGPGAVSLFAVEELLALGSLVRLATDEVDLTRPLHAVWAPGRKLKGTARSLLLLAQDRSQDSA